MWSVSKVLVVTTGVSRKIHEPPFKTSGLNVTALSGPQYYPLPSRNSGSTLAHILLELIFKIRELAGFQTLLLETG